MKRKRKKRVVVWFVEPLDGKTNAVIAHGRFDDDILTDMKCVAGEVHDVWRVPHREVTKLLRSKEYLHLSFRIFRREGLYGKPREWQFEA